MKTKPHTLLIGLLIVVAVTGLHLPGLDQLFASVLVANPAGVILLFNQHSAAQRSLQGAPERQPPGDATGFPLGPEATPLEAAAPTVQSTDTDGNLPEQLPVEESSGREPAPVEVAPTAQSTDGALPEQSPIEVTLSTAVPTAEHEVTPLEVATSETAPHPEAGAQETRQSETTPAVPTVPTIPTVPTVPAVPTVPTVPAVPTVPTVPAVPTVPTVPAVPTVPTVPAVPTDSTRVVVPSTEPPPTPTDSLPTATVVPTEPIVSPSPDPIEPTGTAWLSPTETPSPSPDPIEPTATPVLIPCPPNAVGIRNRWHWLPEATHLWTRAGVYN